MLKYLIRGCIILGVFFSLVALKMVYMQREHFTRAEKYYASLDWKLAIRQYDETMHFYTPWSPYITKSAERLWQIGELFEKEGKPDWALISYSAIRSSFYASRSLYTPHKDWIAKCDEKIADLNVKLLIKDGSVSPADGDAEKRKQLHVLKVDRAPAPLWSVAVEASLFGWIASVMFIVIRGFDDKGKPRWRAVTHGMVSFFLTFAFWVLSLIKA
jgi:hypothetical protein